MKMEEVGLQQENEELQKELVKIIQNKPKKILEEKIKELKEKMSFVRGKDE